jgi:hypothetical protein
LVLLLGLQKFLVIEVLLFFVQLLEFDVGITHKAVIFIEIIGSNDS